MTLSVPLTIELAQKIDLLIKMGLASNKAELARKAIEKYIEDEAVNLVLKAEQEAKEGKILKGDLDSLSKIL
jgi:Arc/MetJ-type ribon-helix-helix transcriptional regulator